MPGTLVLCATPIGNLGDVSARLAETLRSADLIYAEDTRRARVLLDHLGVDRPVRSYFVGNEEARSVELASRLQAGEVVALISDAGTPAISDPGVSAVHAARAADAVVSAVPGPSAVTMAVALSGFGGDRFVFEGFLPRKRSERSRRVRAMAEEFRPVVFFTTPHRFLTDLEELSAAAGGDRTLCVTRELTKRFEEIWWGTVTEAIERWSEMEPRGEFTVVLEPVRQAPPDLDAAVELARDLIAKGATRSEAAREAAERTGVRRRSIYEGIGTQSVN